MATEDHLGPQWGGGTFGSSYQAKHAKPGAGSYFASAGTASGTSHGQHAGPDTRTPAAPRSSKARGPAKPEPSAWRRRQAASATKKAHSEGKSATGLSGTVKKATSKVRGR